MNLFRLTTLSFVAMIAWHVASAAGSAVLSSPAPVSVPKAMAEPDFAFPKDVIATARAFLDANGHDNPGTLLAVTEIVSAQSHIDRMSSLDNIAFTLKLGDTCSDPATRAMIYCYGATLCANEAPGASGVEMQARPADMTNWSAKDFYVASDSLYRLAYDTAPAAAMLKPFGQALVVNELSYKLTPTVRDFVLLKYSSLAKTEPSVIPDDSPLKQLPADSPLAIYNSVTNGYYKIDPADLDNPNGIFAVAVFLADSKYSISSEYALKVLRKAADQYADSWLEPYIKSAIDYYSQPNWEVSVPSLIYPDSDFKVNLASQFTDSVALDFYGYRTWEDANPATQKTNTVATGYIHKQRLVIHADSKEKRIATYQTTRLPAGIYIMQYSYTDSDGQLRVLTSETINVSNVHCQLIVSGDNNIANVINTSTGAPVKGATVLCHDGKSVRKYVTDQMGAAVITGPGYLTLTPPGTKLVFNTGINIYNNPTKNNNKDKSQTTRAVLTTDRPVYRPGETVRFSCVLQNNDSTIAGAKTDISVSWPRPNNNMSPDTTFTLGPSDRFGRIEGHITVPGDAAVGTALLMANDDYIRFSVADMKLPDLNITDLQTVVDGKSVTVSGRTVNSANVGRSGINLTLECNNDTLTTTSADNGLFSFTFRRDADLDVDDDCTVESVFGTFPCNIASNWYMDTYYTIFAASPDGKSADTQGRFPSFSDATISVRCVSDIANTSDGFTFDINVTDYTKDNRLANLDINWAICNDSDSIIVRGKALPGKVVIGPDILAKLPTDNYTLYIQGVAGVTNLTMTTLYIYHPDHFGTPDNTPFFLLDSDIKAEPGSKVARIPVLVNKPGTIIWWYEPQQGNNPAAGLRNKIINTPCDTICINLPHTDSKASTCSAKLWTIVDCSYFNKLVTITPPETSGTGLQLTCQSFRDKTIPGSKEQWQLYTSFNNEPVQAAVFVNIYNTALEQFGSVSSPNPRRYDWLNTSTYSLKTTFSRYNKTPFNSPRYVQYPDVSPLRGMAATWKYLPIPFYRNMIMKRSSAGAVTTEMANLGAPMMEDVTVMGYGITKKTDSVQDEYALSVTIVPLRESIACNAAWQPMLTTDSISGTADLTFTVPNQNSTWCLLAKAWTADLTEASLKRRFVAAKPVIVSPNLPRFVRVGDTVNLVTAITNATDSAQTVTYAVTVGNTDATGSITLDGGQTRYVNTPVSITGQIALQDSLSLTVRASDGIYGDGERIAIPILPSTALVTESSNFYLNPSDSTFDMTATTGDDAQTELHFTANPMWTVVRSLPSTMATPCLEIANAYVRAWYIGHTAQLIVNEHPAAASVIDADLARATAAKALSGLKALRADNGGFKWGTWQHDANLFTTLNILEWMDQDVDDPQVSKLVAGALTYVDNNIVPKGSEPTADLYYAYVRSAYGKPTTLAGQQVVDKTVKYVLDNWRKMSLTDKCYAANLLHRTGNEASARLILSSISQFGKITPTQGMVFPNMPGVNGYASLLEAFGAILPASPETDAIRQGLIVQRRGASWGSDAWTSFAVRAMVRTGTDWTVPALGVTVQVDGTTILPDSTAALTGAFTIPVNGSKITLTRQGSYPAYGSLVTRRIAPLSDVKAFADDGFAIAKTLYRTDSKGRRVALEKDIPMPGERVFVNIRLTAPRDMTNVVVTDQRPAAFEPAEQLGRYSRTSTGTWYYLANRDQQTDIYLDRLPRGTTVIEYEVIVNNTGTFTTGMATATSDIDPDLTVHSASTTLVLHNSR